MNPVFVRTSNVERFLSGIEECEDRGSREASMLLVVGDPGYGKTTTTQWWTVQKGGVYIRVKKAYTSHWLLGDLARELRLAPGHKSEEIYNQVLEVLVKRPRPIVLDEVDKATNIADVVETVRDLSDLVEIPVVLVGIDRALAKISRFTQISSRISKVVSFLPASLEDVRLCCDELCEVPVAGDLVEEIHRQAMGRIRQVKNAIAKVEICGKRNSKKTVTKADMAGQELCHDWQLRPSRLGKGSGTQIDRMCHSQTGEAGAPPLSRRASRMDG
jgi:DNA transposition AAA+ family ATPase